MVLGFKYHRRKWAWYLNFITMSKATVVLEFQYLRLTDKGTEIYVPCSLRTAVPKFIYHGFGEIVIKSIYHHLNLGGS